MIGHLVAMLVSAVAFFGAILLYGAFSPRRLKGWKFWLCFAVYCTLMEGAGPLANGLYSACGILGGGVGRQTLYKLYCAECGSVFSRKVRANGVVVWGCRKHLDKSELCPVKPVYEADLYRAFLSMYNKLQANREKILSPALDDLASLRYLQEQRNSERVTITEEIQRLGKQNHNLERLRTTGCIDSAQYWERRAVIEQQLIEKKALLMRRVFNKNIEKALRQTKEINNLLAAGPPLTDFDEATFTALVSRVQISSTAITFGLINGMKLTEGRTEP